MALTNGYYPPLRQTSSVSDYTPSMMRYTPSSTPDRPAPAVRTSSTSSDYTPLRSLRITPSAAATTPQVVFSKVAQKPVLHHAQSWTPGTQTQSNFIIPKYEPHSAGNSVNYTSYSSLGRRSTASDYAYPPSHSQSDYESDGSMPRGRPKLVRTDALSLDHGLMYNGGRAAPPGGRSCDCDPYSLCSVCLSTSNSQASTPAREEMPTLSETEVYDSLTPASPPAQLVMNNTARYAKHARRVHSERAATNTRTAPPARLGGSQRTTTPAHRRLDYITRQSNHSRSMDHIVVSSGGGGGVERSPQKHPRLSGKLSNGYELFANPASVVRAGDMSQTAVTNQFNYPVLKLNEVKPHSSKNQQKPTDVNINNNKSVKFTPQSQRTESAVVAPSSSTRRHQSMRLPVPATPSDDNDSSYDRITPDIIPPQSNKRRRSVDSKASTPSSTATGSLVRKEWNRLRNLLSAVSAVKSGASNKSKASPRLSSKTNSTTSRHADGVRTLETESEREAAACECCHDSNMKCPASFDRRIQSARSCESLLASGNRIPSLDLGEGHVQVSPYF